MAKPTELPGPLSSTLALRICFPDRKTPCGAYRLDGSTEIVVTSRFRTESVHVYLCVHVYAYSVNRIRARICRSLLRNTLRLPIVQHHPEVNVA
jgi:hypothetical protein